MLKRLQASLPNLKLIKMKFKLVSLIGIIFAFCYADLQTEAIDTEEWQTLENLTVETNTEVLALIDYQSGLIFYKDESVPVCLVEVLEEELGLKFLEDVGLLEFRIQISSENSSLPDNNADLFKLSPSPVSELGNAFCNGLPIVKKSFVSSDHLRRKRQANGNNGYYRSSAPVGEAKAQTNWNTPGQASQAQVQGQVFGKGFFSGQAQSQNGGLSQSQVQLAGVGISGQIASSSGNAQAQLSLGTGAGSGQASGLGQGPSNSQVQVSLGQNGEESMASASATSGGSTAGVGNLAAGGNVYGRGGGAYLQPTGFGSGGGTIGTEGVGGYPGSGYGYTHGAKIPQESISPGVSGDQYGGTDQIPPQGAFIPQHSGQLGQGSGLPQGFRPGIGYGNGYSFPGQAGGNGASRPSNGAHVTDESRLPAGTVGTEGRGTGSIGTGISSGQGHNIPGVITGQGVGLSGIGTATGGHGGGPSHGLQGTSLSGTGGIERQTGQGGAIPGAHLQPGVYDAGYGATKPIGNGVNGRTVGLHGIGSHGSSGIDPNNQGGHNVQGPTSNGYQTPSLRPSTNGISGGATPVGTNGRYYGTYGGVPGTSGNGYRNGYSGGGASRPFAQSSTPGAFAQTFGTGQAQAQTVYFGSIGNGQYAPIRYDQSSQPGNGGGGTSRYQDQQVGFGTAGQRQQTGHPLSGQNGAINYRNGYRQSGYATTLGAGGIPGSSVPGIQQGTVNGYRTQYGTGDITSGATPGVKQSTGNGHGAQYGAGASPGGAAPSNQQGTGNGYAAQYGTGASPGGAAPSNQQGTGNGYAAQYGAGGSPGAQQNGRTATHSTDFLTGQPSGQEGIHGYDGISGPRGTPTSGTALDQTPGQTVPTTGQRNGARHTQSQLPGSYHQAPTLTQNGHRQTTSTTTTGRNGNTHTTNGYIQQPSSQPHSSLPTPGNGQAYRVDEHGRVVPSSQSRQPVVTDTSRGTSPHDGQDGFSPSYGVSKPSTDDPDGKKCTIVTFSCTIVIESNGRAKICKPNAVKINGNNNNGYHGSNGGRNSAGSQICCC